MSSSSGERLAHEYHTAQASERSVGTTSADDDPLCRRNHCQIASSLAASEHLTGLRSRSGIEVDDVGTDNGYDKDVEVETLLVEKD